MPRTVTSEAAETLDALCWRALGSTVPVEAVYAANPGLAALGPVLPIGTAVVIPDAALPNSTGSGAASAPVRETIQLWS